MYVDNFLKFREIYYHVIFSTLQMKWLIGQEGYDTINGGGVQSARAGQASKTGARAARVVRVVRMVRLVRMAKLYKYAAAAAEKEKLKK